MNAIRASLLRSFLHLPVPAAILAALFFSASAGAAEFQRRVLSDGTSLVLYNPAVATDRNGSLHIAAQGQPVTPAGVPDKTEIYYLMVDATGTLLIGPTQINTPDAVRDGRPAIGVTPNGKVVIAWQKNNNHRPRYVLVNPSGAPHNGQPANPTSLLAASESFVNGTTDAGYRHLQLAVDRNGIAHVVAATSSSSALRYFSFNPATNAAVTAEEIVGHVPGTRVAPAMALDSKGNVHIAFQSSDINSKGPAAYMMLNGANGVVLIAPSQLYTASPGVYPHAAHFSLMVDSTDVVHIVYGDKRNTKDVHSSSSAGEHFYVQLVPANAPKDGSPVDIASIRRSSEVALGGVWYSRAFLFGGKIHFFSNSKGGGDLVYRSIAAGGSTPSEPRVYSAQLTGWQWSRFYPTSGGGWLIWSEAASLSGGQQGTAKLVMARLPTS